MHQTHLFEMVSKVLMVLYLVNSILEHRLICFHHLHHLAFFLLLIVVYCVFAPQVIILFISIPFQFAFISQTPIVPTPPSPLPPPTTWPTPPTWPSPPLTWLISPKSVLISSLSPRPPTTIYAQPILFLSTTTSTLAPLLLLIIDAILRTLIT